MHAHYHRAPPFIMGTNPALFQMWGHPRTRTRIALHALLQTARWQCLALVRLHSRAVERGRSRDKKQALRAKLASARGWAMLARGALARDRIAHGPRY